MNKLLLVCLLLLSASPTLAKTWTTPSGKIVEAEHPTWTIVKKVWILPSGLAYIAEHLIPIARAGSFTLREEIELWHDSMASLFGINSKETKETNQCESNWNNRPEWAITVYGDEGKAYGITQMHERTFNLWRKESKMPELDYYSWKDQLKLQAWAFSKGEKYKDDWTCYVMIFIKKTRPISTNWQ